MLGKFVLQICSKFTGEDPCNFNKVAWRAAPSVAGGLLLCAASSVGLLLYGEDLLVNFKLFSRISASERLTLVQIK